MVCYWAATMVLTKAASKVCCLAEHWVSKKAALWVALWDAKTAEQMVCHWAATTVLTTAAPKACSWAAAWVSMKADQ